MPPITAAIAACSIVAIAATTAAFSATRICKPARKARSPSKRRHRTSFKNAHRYLNDSEFSRTFRMPRQAFNDLLNIIEVDLIRDAVQAARSSGGVIEPAVRLGITLRILSGSSYLDLMMLFRIGRSTVFVVFHSTIDAINRHLSMPGIPLGDVSRLRGLAMGFSSSRACSSPLYGCVGALDGISIEIMKPLDKYVPRNFFCRKGMYALPVQAIVDSTYRFTYMSCNCVGSTHDELSFACSRLGQLLQDGGSSALHSYWIAADAAYVCENGLLTPWSKGQLMDGEEGLFRDSFNYFHSSLRIHVEQSFGMLVARFGILWRPLRFSITRVGPIISSCMKLHNFCIAHGLPPTRLSMTHDERRVSDAAFRRWWSAAAASRDNPRGGQGRRSDLKESWTRKELTKHLSDHSITRPL
jgi:hypothetical protein